MLGVCAKVRRALSAILAALVMLSLVPGAMGGTETYARALTRELDTARVDAHAFVPRGAAGFSESIPETVVPEVTAGPSTRERLTVAGLGVARGVRRDDRAAVAPPRLLLRLVARTVHHGRRPLRSGGRSVLPPL